MSGSTASPRSGTGGAGPARTASAAPKRADARRNVAAILEAATACLAVDPDASVQDIARVAGVGRVTLYGHFETRSALVSAVVERAVEQTDRELSALDLGGDPAEALERLLSVTWRLTNRYGALVVAGEAALPADRLREVHADPVRRATQLLRRGRREGRFRTDMPVAWQVTVLQGILHAAFTAAHRGEISERQAPALVCATALAAVAARD